MNTYIFILNPYQRTTVNQNISTFCEINVLVIGDKRLSVDHNKNNY